jgi:hypothetical protein
MFNNPGPKSGVINYETVMESDPNIIPEVNFEIGCCKCIFEFAALLLYCWHQGVHRTIILVLKK